MAPRLLFPAVGLVSLGIAALIVGCDGQDPLPDCPPAATVSPLPAQAAPLQAPATSATGPAAPATLIHDSQVLTGPEAGARVLGERKAGTAVQVAEVVGTRAHIFERDDPRLASWVELPALALARADWARFRPALAASMLEVYLPDRSTIPSSVAAAVLHSASAFLESFLEDGAPGVRWQVRSDLGSSGALLSGEIAPAPRPPQLRDPGPKPPTFDRDGRKTYDAIVWDNQCRQERYQQQRASFEADSRTQLAALLKLDQPLQANAGRALVQLGRDLSQADAPGRRAVLLLDPIREAPPSAAGLDLRGVPVVPVFHCSADPAACVAAEQAWRALLANGGALAQPSFDALSPSLALAFNPAQPELR